MKLEELEFKLSEERPWERFDSSQVEKLTTFISSRQQIKLPEAINCPIISLRKRDVSQASQHYWEASISRSRLLDCLTIDEAKRANENKTKLSIVYFANLTLSKNWESIMRPQIIELAKGIKSLKGKCGIRVIICLNCTPQDLTIASFLCKEILKDHWGLDSRVKLIINYSDVECYEWHGINTVWQESKLDTCENHYTLYFHGKGMSTLDKRSGYRHFAEKYSTQQLVSLLNKNIDILNTLSFVDRLGLASSEAGFMWYNFWIARNSYLAGNEQPELRPDYRYYYEAWLSRNKSHKNINENDLRRISGCFNLVRTHDQAYNISQAVDPHCFNKFVHIAAAF